MNSRFEDPKAHIFDFIKEILVYCPSCNGKGVVLSEELSRARFVCESCGKNRDWVSKKCQWVISKRDVEKDIVQFGISKDPFFKLPLFIQTRIGNDVLWAFNLSHLTLIKEYVGAKIRGRGRSDPWIRNKSLVSRLPRFIQSSRNRDQILKAIKRLESKN
jgi:hypothetical protein